MSLIDGSLLHMNADDPQVQEKVAKGLEALYLKQMLKDSKALNFGEGPRGKMTADLFLDVIAEAVAESQPLGLAKHLPELNKAANPIRDLTDLVGGDSKITSGYGERRDPFHPGQHQQHHGVDIAADPGSPIFSAKNGRVTFAGDRGGYGSVVEVTHGDGTVAIYAHMSNIKAKNGDFVRAGETLGEVGNTGRSTGPHLHFEFRSHNRPVDPLQALKTYKQRVDNWARAANSSLPRRGGPHG
jgi:murein DD-endopeptidase MepM/ murein hydrolase activator NlpD